MVVSLCGLPGLAIAVGITLRIAVVVFFVVVVVLLVVVVVVVLLAVVAVVRSDVVLFLAVIAWALAGGVVTVRLVVGTAVCRGVEAVTTGESRGAVAVTAMVPGEAVVVSAERCTT